MSMKGPDQRLRVRLLKHYLRPRRSLRSVFDSSCQMVGFSMGQPLVVACASRVGLPVALQTLIILTRIYTWEKHGLLEFIFEAWHSSILKMSVEHLPRPLRMR